MKTKTAVSAKRIICFFLSLGMFLTCIFIPFGNSASAASQVIHGDYVLVLNKSTDHTVSQSTGTLVFDSDGVSAPAKSVDTRFDFVSSQNETGQSKDYVRAPITYSLGDTLNVDGIDCVLIGIGEHCYIWMETSLKAEYDNADITSIAAMEMIDVYEAMPYTILTEMANGAIPCNDGSNKLSIVMEIPSFSASGYYYASKTLTAIHVRAKQASSYSYGSLHSLNGLLVHEGQHALYFNLACNKSYQLSMDDLWLNEGLSVTAMDYTWGGGEGGGWLSYISSSTSVRGGANLVYDEYRDELALDYSMPFLFVRYLCDQYAGRYNPMNFLKLFYTIKRSDYDECKDYLNAIFIAGGLKDENNAALTFEKALQNFYIACVRLDNEGVYGFCNDPAVAESLGDYPLFLDQSPCSTDLYGTGAIIIKTVNGSFTVPDDAGSDIVFVAFNENTDDGMPIGEGTSASPYLISDADDLAGIVRRPAKYYRLTNDIDLSGKTYVTCESFTGTLDGDGYKITNLKRALVYQNLGVIKNLTLEINFNEEYTDYVGAFANVNTGTIIDCDVSGSITGYIFNSTSYSPVQIGAITGNNDNAGVIERCYSNTVITVKLPMINAYVGELCGQNNGRMTNCYTKGSLNVNQPFDSNIQLMVGGICGKMVDTYFVASISKSYSVTDISVNASGANLNKSIGRIAGHITFRIQNYCFVSDLYALQGLPVVGLNALSTDLSSCAKTSAQLKNEATFENWDFSAVWKLEEGVSYPSFIREEDINEITVHLQRNAYYVGERLDLTNAYLSVNGSTVNNIGEYINDYSLNQTGNITLNGEYMSKPFSFSVSVSAPDANDISSLTVYRQAQSQYTQGQSFNADNLILLAVINGENAYIYSGYTYDKPLPLTTDDTAVTYTYFSKTVQQQISVSLKRPTEINVISDFQKTAYTSSDKLNLSGLSVRLTYNDASLSALIPYEDFSQNNIHIAQNVSGTLVAFDETQELLSVADDSTSFYVYVGNINDIIYSYITDISVYAPVSFPSQISLRLTVNMDNYKYTDEVTGGSGDYSAALISGTLPAGVSMQTPSALNSFCFIVSGTPTQKGEYTLTYRITDKGSSSYVDTQITLNVTDPSSECLITSFLVPKSFNVGKITEDVSGIIDNENLTISLLFPNGTDLSAISATLIISEGASVSPWNGTAMDYTSDQPVIYTVTAEDGVTQKIYTVTATTAKLGTLDTPQNLSWTNRTLSYSAVANAGGYNIKLYRIISQDNMELIDSVFTGNTSIDLSEKMTGLKPFSVKVSAVDLLENYSSSADAVSPTFVPVSGITVACTSDTLSLNETMSFTAEVLPVNATNKAVVWSVQNNNSSAQISQSGVLNPISQGTVTVRATCADDASIYAEKSISIVSDNTLTISLTPPSGYTNEVIYLNGEAHTAQTEDSIFSVSTDKTNYNNAVMYKYNANNIPTGMYVWTLSYSQASNTYTATPVPELSDILSYHGFSIRVTGAAGIRFKTGISVDTRGRLLSSSGLNGFKLVEYGTCVMNNANRSSYDFVKGGEKVSSGRSYWVSNKVNDYVFETKSNRYRFTSVLINIAVKNYKTEYAFRGYIILRKNGIDYTIYGPPMYRSIYTVANQVISSGEFSSGSSADVFVRKIITDADKYTD